jgi:plastocyanin
VHIVPQLGRKGLATILIACLALVACGDDDEGGASDTTAATAPPGSVITGTGEVQAIDNSFRPEEVAVAAGTEVVWTNEGRNDHNIVPVDPDQDFGVDTDDFGPGDVHRFTFEEPGTYRYFCSLHGNATSGMIGLVEVVEA